MRSILWNVMMRRLGAVRIRSSLGSERRKLRGLQIRSGRLGNRCISRNMRKCAQMRKLGDMWVSSRLGDIWESRRLGDMWKRLLSTVSHAGLCRLRRATIVTYLLTRNEQFS